MTKKIALLTCKDFTGIGGHDDYLLIEYLKQNDVEAVELIWREAHDWSQYELVLVRTTWDYSKHREEFTNVLKEINSKTTLYNPLELMLWNMEKLYLKELKEQGVNTIATLWLSSEEEIVFGNICKELAVDKFILKPSVGAGSSGLKKIEGPQDLKQLPKELTASPFMMAQPFIEGVLQGEKSFLYFDGKFSHAISKTPKEGDFRSQEEFGATVTAYIPSERELKLCEETLLKLPIKPLYARLDFLPTEDGLLLIELEMIEPHLYLSWDDNAAKNIGKTLIRVLN